MARIAEYEKKNGAAKARRKLATARTDLTMEKCMGEFFQGTFEEDCVKHVKAEKAKRDEEVNETEKARKAAEDAAKSADEAAAKAEDSVTDAWTAPVKTAGKSVAELIEENYGKLMKARLALAKDKQNQQLIDTVAGI